MEKTVFYDESGKAMEFIIQGKFSIDENDYIAMIPANEENPYVYILRITFDENGEEVLEGIDDDELEEASKIYEELLQEKLQ